MTRRLQKRTVNGVTQYRIFDSDTNATEEVSEEKAFELAPGLRPASSQTVTTPNLSQPTAQPSAVPSKTGTVKLRRNKDTGEWALYDVDENFTYPIDQDTANLLREKQAGKVLSSYGERAVKNFGRSFKSIFTEDIPSLFEPGTYTTMGDLVMGLLSMVPYKRLEPEGPLHPRVGEKSGYQIKPLGHLNVITAESPGTSELIGPAYSAEEKEKGQQLVKAIWDQLKQTYSNPLEYIANDPAHALLDIASIASGLGVAFRLSAAGTSMVSAAGKGSKWARLLTTTGKTLEEVGAAPLWPVRRGMKEAGKLLLHVGNKEAAKRILEAVGLLREGWGGAESIRERSKNLLNSGNYEMMSEWMDSDKFINDIEKSIRRAEIPSDEQDLLINKARAAQEGIRNNFAVFASEIEDTQLRKIVAQEVKKFQDKLNISLVQKGKYWIDNTTKKHVTDNEILKKIRDNPLVDEYTEIGKTDKGHWSQDEQLRLRKAYVDWKMKNMSVREMYSRFSNIDPKIKNAAILNRNASRILDDMLMLDEMKKVPELKRLAEHLDVFTNLEKARADILDHVVKSGGKKGGGISAIAAGGFGAVGITAEGVGKTLGLGGAALSAFVATLRNPTARSALANLFYHGGDLLKYSPILYGLATTAASIESTINAPKPTKNIQRKLDELKLHKKARPAAPGEIPRQQGDILKTPKFRPRSSLGPLKGQTISDMTGKRWRVLGGPVNPQQKNALLSMINPTYPFLQQNRPA